jgi:hypothetical protein
MIPLRCRYPAGAVKSGKRTWVGGAPDTFSTASKPFARFLGGGNSATCSCHLLPLRDDIERCAERGAGHAARIPQQRLADDPERHAVLQGNRRDHRGVAGVDVALAPRLRILKEHLGDPAVGEARDRRRVVQAGALDHYYEAIVPNPPMAANDDKAVVCGFTGVVTVDHDPFNNKGPVSPPVVIFSRDFTPPAPPPIPTLQKGPDPTDKGANAVATLRWAADGRYQYHLMRLPGRRLAAEPPPTDPPPVCLAPETPTCTGTDAMCMEAKRRFGQRVKAAAHPELFGTATMAPEKPYASGGGFEFLHQDTVDATEGDDWLYAGRAIDPAGNVSAIGCPQIVVVRDFMPPRPPTVSEAVGLEGSIRLRWTANPESDLHRYRLYRTTEIGRDGSLDRMTLILETDAMRVAIAPPGAGNATRTGSGTAYITFTWTDPEVKAVRDHFYRLVAVDQSGNISEPSAAARARAFDTRPPAPPQWDATTPVQRGTDAAGNFVRLRFAPPPGDADVRFRIQRRDTGAAFWRPVSDWLPAGSTQHEDRRVLAGQGYTYRIQAMDPAGNVGEFNEPRSAQ